MKEKSVKRLKLFLKVVFSPFKIKVGELCTRHRFVLVGVVCFYSALVVVVCERMTRNSQMFQNGLKICICMFRPTANDVPKFHSFRCLQCTGDLR